jgi:hypothetical protein
LLSNLGGTIVLSGSGTSGRIAFLVATSFNQVLRDLGKRQVFKYLISGLLTFPNAKKISNQCLGGDKSIIMSYELPEDDPLTGVSDLKQLELPDAEINSMVFIGISCGLSAPYAVGKNTARTFRNLSLGQADYASKNPLYAATILIGFNPIEFSRNVPVEKWDKTCYIVTKEIHYQMNFNDSSTV